MLAPFSDPQHSFWARFDAFTDALHLRGVAIAGCVLMLAATLALGNYEHAALVAVVFAVGWWATRPCPEPLSDEGSLPASAPVEDPGPIVAKSPERWLITQGAVQMREGYEPALIPVARVVDPEYDPMFDR